mgnify:FL=1
MPERVDCAEILRAAADPGRLAYYLNDYGIIGICDRLRCDAETALRLQLHAMPDVYEWRQSIQTISGTLALDPCALSALLVDAILP